MLALESRVMGENNTQQKHEMAPPGPPSRTAAFNKLPVELNWAIAHFLETDADIVSFRSVCRQTRDAIEGDMGSFWLAKFRQQYAYDIGDGRAKTVVKGEYQHRAKHLNRGVSMSFRQQGHNSREIKVLLVLRALIVESFRGAQGRDKHGQPRCLNQDRIAQFILSSKDFLGIKSIMPASSPRSKDLSKPNGPTPLLTAVQIMCAQLLFQMPGLKYNIYSFGDSQKMVYQYHRTQPIFIGQGNLQVNMEWVLHCMNFFRHHMVREEAATLYDTMQSMDATDRPSAWQAPLQAGSYHLSSNWKGTYTYLESKEVDEIREQSKKKDFDDDVFMDKNIEEGGNIQDLQLQFVEEGQLPWPQSFESRLNSNRPTLAPRTRAQHRLPKSAADPVSIRLQGEGLDQKDHFFASGWLNPLAPQEGIPGWQRVTLMKHFDADYSQVHNDDLWAYEGVVLPGGRLIFGRWWFANAEPTTPDYGSYSGPFVLWAVDSSFSLPDMDSDDRE